MMKAVIEGLPLLPLGFSSGLIMGDDDCDWDGGGGGEDNDKWGSGSPASWTNAKSASPFQVSAFAPLSLHPVIEAR